MPEIENAIEATDENKPTKERRGFAVMNPERVREIARMGGQAAHRVGHAHEFSRDEAREAGRKGGLAPHVVRGRPIETVR